MAHVGHEDEGEVEQIWTLITVIHFNDCLSKNLTPATHSDSPKFAHTWYLMKMYS